LAAHVGDHGGDLFAGDLAEPALAEAGDQVLLERPDVELVCVGRGSLRTYAVAAETPGIGRHEINLWDARIRSCLENGRFVVSG
jgi:hypothetical protein